MNTIKVVLDQDFDRKITIIYFYTIQPIELFSRKSSI